ncbi:hypothetical protein ACFZC5_14525 [Nocardia gamkensis]|uniref:hypothetical protein n=1 Tax=Nocardia gamkensis TaxID=352869 RepID=UPI0036EFDA9D
MPPLREPRPRQATVTLPDDIVARPQPGGPVPRDVHGGRLFAPRAVAAPGPPPLSGREVDAPHAGAA